ncbi:MAG: 30S ribosomal protein S20 [Candidatus Limnocylindrales bacterium]
MAHSPRGWTGARTPSAIKRVRTAERRRAINQPRRSAAKTFVSTALKVATGAQEGDTAQALADAMSALDKAAKVGAIHPNAAARRKSRLALKLDALAAGTQVHAGGRVTKTTGKAAAAKAARTRIATSKATKVKGVQTAAGKARAALSRTARAEAAHAAAIAAAAATAEAKPARPARSTAAGAAARPATLKPGAKATAKTKPVTAKATTSKTATTRAASKVTSKAATAATKAAPKATSTRTSKPKASEES